MRLILTAAMALAVSGCGTEKSSDGVVPEADEKARAIVALELEKVRASEAGARNDEAGMGYDTGNVPPCFPVHQDARNVRAEQRESQYGNRFELRYTVDAPAPDVVEFLKRTVAENGCRLDHTQSRNGMEFFTLWSEKSLSRERSAQLHVGSAQDSPNMTVVSGSGHWIEP